MSPGERINAIARLGVELVEARNVKDAAQRDARVAEVTAALKALGAHVDAGGFVYTPTWMDSAGRAIRVGDAVVSVLGVYMVVESFDDDGYARFCGRPGEVRYLSHCTKVTRPMMTPAERAEWIFTRYAGVFARLAQ